MRPDVPGIVERPSPGRGRFLWGKRQSLTATEARLSAQAQEQQTWSNGWRKAWTHEPSGTIWIHTLGVDDLTVHEATEGYSDLVQHFAETFLVEAPKP